MLKTNNKVFLQKIDAYILDSVNDWFIDNENYLSIIENEKLKKALKEKDKKILSLRVLKSFYIQSLHFDPHVKKSLSDYRYSINLYEYFEKWCSGLPSILNCCYYYNVSAVNLLGDMLEQTTEQRNRFSECESEKALTGIIWNRLLKNSGMNYYSIMKGEF